GVLGEYSIRNNCCKKLAILAAVCVFVRYTRYEEASTRNDHSAKKNGQDEPGRVFFFTGKRFTLPAEPEGACSLVRVPKPSSSVHPPRPAWACWARGRLAASLPVEPV